MSSNHQADWEQLVDAIAAMDSTAPLAKDYKPDDYFPNQTAPTPGLIEAVRAAGADFNASARHLFQPRVTEQESFRAIPVAPTFASTKNALKPITVEDIHLDDDEEEEREGADGQQQQRRRRRHRTALQEGRADTRDFYALYRAAAAATKNAEAAASVVGADSDDVNGNALTSSSAGGEAALLSRMTLLTSGFLDTASYNQIHRQPDFLPIILIPSTVTSPLQLVNIRTFLSEGMYVDPPTLFVDAQTGSTNVLETKPDSVTVSPGGFVDPSNHCVAFRNFRVLDDPAKVEDWSHVCACLVNGKTWEFSGWFPHEADPRATQPSYLFSRLCGFLPYFEEDKVPAAVGEWNVQPILLTRRAMKTQQHIKEVFKFWERLYAFLDHHARFKCYDVPVEEQ